MNHKKRIIQYDSIRTWCTLLIIVGHLDVYISSNMIGNGIPLFRLWGYANGTILNIAVSIFFILSGASLMYSYGDREFLLKEYVWKRMRAIYPMFYVAWLFFYFWYFFHGNTIRAEIWKIILTILGIDGYLTAIMNNFYLIGEWFLAIIIILYMAFPILLWIKRKSIFLLILIAIGCYMSGCLLGGYTGINIYSFPATRVLEFTFGMLFTEYYRIISHKYKNIIGGFACVVFTILLFVKFDVFYMHMYLFMGIVSFITFFVISTLLCKIPIYRNLCIEFGKISYPVYLVHHQILGIIASKFFYMQISRWDMYIMFFGALCIIIISGYFLKKATIVIIEKLKFMLH